MARKPKPPGGRNGPSFFKVLLDNFSSKLRIPSAFIYHFEDTAPRTCKLWTPAKRFWNVDFQKKDKGLFFQNGWSAFVEENSLEDRDFLLFYYNGNAEFYVEIYGQNCCQKVFVATSESCKPPFYEEGNVDIHGMKVLAHGSGANAAVPKRSEVVDINSDSSYNDENVKPSSHHQHRTRSLRLRGNSTIEPREMSTKSVTSQKKAAAVDAANKFTSRYPSFEVVMKPAYLQSGFMNIPSRFFKEHMTGSPERVTLLDSNELWPVKLVYFRTHARFSRGWNPFVRKNNLQEGDVCIFELIKRNDVLLKVSVRKCAS